VGFEGECMQRRPERQAKQGGATCHPAFERTLPTDRTLFLGVLLGVTVIVGGLIYLPALALGPIVENLQM
jgi:K+-transporting ATPase A subunit